MNAPRAGDGGLRVAMINAAVQLAQVGMHPVAERLFRRQWRDGKGLNRWCAGWFLVTCWRLRHDREEIVHLLSQSAGVKPGFLAEFAPELAEGVGDTPSQG